MLRLRTLLLAVLFASPMAAANFYVSASGSDANDGRSSQRAWRTIARAMTATYSGGDAILFEGGQTFTGTLFFTPLNVTTVAGVPLVVSSYGIGRATIASGREIGINIHNLSQVMVQSLDLKGEALNAGNAGIAVISDSGTTISAFHFSDVGISGYTNGLVVLAATPPSKVRGVRMLRSVIQDNALGMAFYGYIDRPAAANGFDYGVGDLSLAENEVHRNKGGGLQGGYGAGIVMINAQDVIIERNRVHDNGGDNPEVSPNGPSAITVYDGRNVVIQQNDVYGQRYDVQNQTDNGGIDIWSLDSFVQYNYVHDNEGWGLILGGADPALGSTFGNWPSRNNTFRYNIVANNGRPRPDTEATQKFHGAQVLMFGELENFEFYNNTFFAAGSTADVHPGAIQGMIYLIDVPGTGKPWSGIRFRNNIFMAEEDAQFIEVPRPNAGTGLVFDHNAYLTLRPTQPVKWGEQTFTTIAGWTAATGQDSNARTGSSALFCGFAPLTGAVVIDAGLDLRQAAINVGARDYRGRAIPIGSAFDLGALEYQPGDDCPRRRAVRR